MSNEQEFKERKQWFIDRIGKRIYRNESFCECHICQEVSKNGLVICNIDQAIYLHDVECCSDGRVKYFEKNE